MNPVQSSRELVREMDRLVPVGEPLTMVGKLRDTALFYTDRRVRLLPDDDPAALVDHLRAGRSAYCLINAATWEDWGRPANLVAALGRDVIVSNRSLAAGDATIRRVATEPTVADTPNVRETALRLPASARAQPGVHVDATR
jgi:hypothetical protein